MRSLPKNLRVHFVPVPEAVARVLPLLERGVGSLHAQLADALLRTAGVPVPRDAFREDLLPPHLRMNFVLIDDADKVIARSRSLAALREQACGRVAAALCEAVAAHDRRDDLGVRRSAGAAGSAAGVRQQIGYPALVDEGDSVGLRVFATPAEARISHERGMRAAHPAGDGARLQVVCAAISPSTCRARSCIARSPRIRC